MRLLLAALLLGACSSGGDDVIDECGPQQPCPSGYTCDDTTRRCIVIGGGGIDASLPDGPSTTPDASAGGPDASTMSYNCGMFQAPSGWTTGSGFRSAVVAEKAPLVQPVAATFAGDAFGGDLFVVDQGAAALLRIKPLTGQVTTFVAAAAWPKATGLLTTIVWDAYGAFDGNLYVGDQGGDGDGDSTIFRITPAGTATVFAAGPGAGLDDIYGMSFSPGGLYAPGLYVSGDTDGTPTNGWGRISSTGVSSTFAAFAGVEGMAIDVSGRFGGGLFASMPNGGGYSGDDTISRISAGGNKGPALVSAQPGIHALTFAPQGPFGGDAYAASWASGKLLRVAPGGGVTELATGLSLTNYDGNILTFSADGKVLFVADRLKSRVVCIEAAP